MAFQFSASNVIFTVWPIDLNQNKLSGHTSQFGWYAFEVDCVYHEQICLWKCANNSANDNPVIITNNHGVHEFPDVRY